MNSDVKTNLLRGNDLFSNLSDFHIDSLVKNSTVEKAKKKDILFHQFDDIDAVYLLIAGKIKVARDITPEKSIIREIVDNNELVGENVFVENAKRSTYAEVIEDATLLKISVTVFMNVATQNFNFAQALLEELAKKVQRLEGRISGFIYVSAKERIVQFLKQQANIKGIKIGIDELLLNHGLSHSQIGFLTDTSRQTVSRVLADLKNDQRIHFSKRRPQKILIRNL